MATVSIDDTDLIVAVRGMDKLWALRSTIRIPLAHVRGAAPDPAVAGGPKGIRAGGTRVPRVITAGTYRHDGENVFWDVRDADKAVVIELRDEKYARLVVQVDEPRATADSINAVLDN